jgi:ATP-binding cassette subfamily B multidrug efflux pump
MARMRAAQAKPQNLKGTFFRLIKELQSEKWIFLLLSLLLIASAVFSIITPVILRDALNDMQSFFSVDQTTLTVNVNWGTLCGKFGLMLGLYVLSALLSWVSEWVGIKIVNDYSFNLRRRFKDKLDHLPLSFFDREPFGETLNKGTNDIDNICQNLYSIVSQSLMGVTMLIGVTIAMFVTSWQLALVVIAMMPVMGITVFLIATKSQKQFKIYREQYGTLEGQVEEGYSGFKIIKLFNQEKQKEAEFAKTNEIMTESDRKSQWISGFIFPSMRFIHNLGFVGVSVVSGLLPGDHVGDLVAFLLFLQIFQQPFQMIGQIAATIQSVFASAERVYKVLDQEEELPDEDGAINSEKDIKGEFVFDKVCFSYSPTKPLIQDMNLKVNPGETVAIVGPTGAGKTTIVNLIMRFYELNSGAIYLDGKKTTSYERNVLRGSIGMVLQDTWLFNGTIRDNIAYGRDDASDEDIVKAAVAARADYFIRTLPEGYDFVLNEDGSNISQGQRQLITIARAIVSQPKILILDEATSSVDTRTEQAIQDALDELMKDKTSFVIAHRLSTIKKAKLILVMDKGKIVETGTHQELLAKKGFYADLYNSQFLGRNPLAPKENPD